MILLGIPCKLAILFTGVAQRFGAPVSRVQGYFEFEVQPLREFFAAKFLYNTAPYSPPGAERRGTKPERFHALARNFYWLNVTRFYAGCYDRGYLPSLIESLDELANDRQFRLLAHPFTLLSMLLKDWVFSQHPKSVNRAVNLLVNSGGVKLLLAAGATTGSHGALLGLPD